MNQILRKTIQWIVFSIVFILFFINVYYFNSDNKYLDAVKISNILKHYQPSENETKLIQNQKKLEQKIVFFTKTWYGGSFVYLKEANAHCSKCLFTEEPTLLGNKSHYDAIVFHGLELSKLVMPNRSSLDQLWVFAAFETPAYHLTILSTYEDKFNLTMTYRTESDIFMPYGSFIKTSNHSSNLLPSLEGFKERRTAAWIVSNCHTLSKREDLVSNLSKHIQLDIYGKCGSHKCNNGWHCRTQIQKKYKFYLAFENSKCKDYITEKAYDALSTEMIPVVYGGADYANLNFPPKSYINVKDFKTIEDLGKYLNHLAQTPEEWLQYFEWRKEYSEGENMFVKGYCELCDALWNSKGKKFIIESIENWWLYGNSSKHLINPIFVC